MKCVRIYSLSDHTILESVKTVEFPVIGGVLKLDITMQHHECSVKGPVPEYLIRIKQSKTCTCTAFEVLEVIVKPDKPYIFDCLNLERYVYFNCCAMHACMALLSVYTHGCMQEVWCTI